MSSAGCDVGTLKMRARALCMGNGQFETRHGSNGMKKTSISDQREECSLLLVVLFRHVLESRAIGGGGITGDVGSGWWCGLAVSGGRAL